MKTLVPNRSYVHIKIIRLKQLITIVHFQFRLTASSLCHPFYRVLLYLRIYFWHLPCFFSSLPLKRTLNILIGKSFRR